MNVVILNDINVNVVKWPNDQAHPTAAKATVDGTENL